MLCQAEQKTTNKEWKLREVPSLTLEVITGLSQGEQLKLDDSPILIGGSEDCDIYLSEPNLSQASLVAELAANKVKVSPIHNSGTEAYFGAGKFKKSISDSTYFSAGDSFCLGGVWLKVSCSRTRSTEKNSSNMAKKREQERKPQVSSDNSDLKSYLSELPFERNNRVDEILQSRTSRNAFKLDADNDKHFLRLAGLKAGSLFLSSIGICALTISVAQGVSKPADLSHSSDLSYSKNLDSNKYSSANYIAAADQEQNYGESLLADIRANIENEANRDLNPEATLHKTASSKKLESNEKEKLPYLKSIFSQMLMARELPQTVSLNYEKGTWVITGHLDKEKHNVLNRMITRFKTEQDIKSPLTNKVKSAFSSLPFEIVQVTSGRYGNIVTQSGDRLFVGDQLAGYQLVAIQDHQLVFTGKSRVTVTW